MKTPALFLSLMICLAVGCDNDADPIESIAGIGDQSLAKTSWGDRGWEREVEDLATRFLTAISERDLDGFMSCWWQSPDVTLVLENGIVVRGYDNIRAGVEGLMEAHSYLNVEVLEISRFRLGDEVYAVGTAVWTRTLKPEYGGGTTSFTERWTDVARKINGTWVYVVDHAHDLTPFTP